MGSISKQSRNAIPGAFRELVENRDKRLFNLISKKVVVKNGGIAPDESLVFGYFDELVDQKMNYRHKSRISSFKLLNLPIGAKLEAVFDPNLKFEIVDIKNKIKDLQDGDIMPISKMAQKYLGGSKNGYDWFPYNNKKLSEIRKETDPDYLK